MPSQVVVSTENNFTKGLITEATGLNFPENAATDTSNCIYSLIGDVYRRNGFDFEVDFENFTFDRTGCAVTTFVWNNPGGNSDQRLMVKQIGNQLTFYDISRVTEIAPLSFWNIGSSPDISANVVTGVTFDKSLECQYAEGNGYLFIFNGNCDPLYCTYSAGVVNVTPIFIQIRDFTGAVDGDSVSFRPPTLTSAHQYNLQNQGWSTGASWTASSTTPNADNGNGVYSWTIQAGLTITIGTVVHAHGDSTSLGNSNFADLYGTVTAYSGTTLTLNVYTSQGTQPVALNRWVFTPLNVGFIDSWFSAQTNYPSNSDVWWYYKDSTGAFNPSSVNNITLSTGNAPRGHYILPAFNQDRGSISGATDITVVATNKRPTTGCWFQGRVWYSGVSDSFPAQGTSDFYSWSNRIYFSSIVDIPSDFGNCYQTNDPTSENLFDEIATDGGEIVIAESGTIHKLFPISNGLLVFANNGVWFITGSQGIGFSPTDYTITKISSVKVLSHTSFVDVMGLPYFWNEDGIYQVTAQQNNSLSVEPITVGTILSFYNKIPVQSAKFAHGDYNPIDYVIYWLYRSTQEADVTSRYQYDSILIYNTYNKSFYTYSISPGSKSEYLHSINYVTFPIIGSTTPEPGFWFGSSYNDGSYRHQFSKEYDTNFVDWGQTSSVIYDSYFVAGYKVHGKGMYKFQPQYIQVFSRTNSAPFAYYIQGIWDYGNSPDSGKWGSSQYVENSQVLQDVVIRRHKIRGRGFTLQFKISSVGQQPFDIIGWSIVDTINTGT